MGVENPDVEIGFLKSTTPDTIRGDVEAGSCLGVGRGSCQYFIGRSSVRSRAACELFSLFSFLTRALDSNCLAMTSYP